MTHLPVPINAISWTTGGIAMYAFSIKTQRTYKQTRNPLAHIYRVLGVTFGTALLFFGAPGLFTDNLHVLRVTYFLADLFVQISLQAAVWLLWFIGLRNKVKLGYLLAVSGTFSFVLMVLQALTSRVHMGTQLIDYVDKPPVLIMKSIIYLIVAMPIGYFLLKQVPRQTSLRAKLKSFIAGMTFIVVGLAATSNNVFDKGSDTVKSSAVVAIFFLIFFLVQLIRPSSSKTAPQIKQY